MGFGGATFKGDVEFKLRVFSPIKFEKIIVERRFELQINSWMCEETYQGKKVYSVQFRSPVIKEYGKIFVTGTLGIANSEFVAGTRARK